MREVRMHYFVPESHKELERLAGETVGVRITDLNNACEMIYYGMFGNEYEFLQQGIDCSDGSERPMERVWGWRTKKDETRFDKNGVTLDPNRRIVAYSPFSNIEGFGERRDLLKSKNKWREPAVDSIA